MPNKSSPESALTLSGLYRNRHMETIMGDVALHQEDFTANRFDRTIAELAQVGASHSPEREVPVGDNEGDGAVKPLGIDEHDRGLDPALAMRVAYLSADELDWMIYDTSKGDPNIGWTYALRFDDAIHAECFDGSWSRLKQAHILGRVVSFGSSRGL